MKTTFLILSGIFTALLLSGCKDGIVDLNKQPLDEYSESSLWTSANDARAALNGCYANWQDGSWIFYMDVASDNGFDPYPWEGYPTLGNPGTLLTPSSTGVPQWDFQTIQKVNWFLNGVDKTPMDEDLKVRMKGEARFLRAYRYFIMSQLYGDVPLITENITTDEANTVSRTSKDEVVQFVIDELGAIAPNLPVSYSGDNVGRITKGAALALKARVELFNEKYADAIKFAQAVMDLGVYGLYPSYSDMFRIQNEHNESIILDVEYKKDDVPMTTVRVTWPELEGGWMSTDPTQDLVDTYEMTNGKTIDDPSSGYDPDHPYENRDPRLHDTIIYPGSMYEGTYFDPLDPSSIDYYQAYSYTGYSLRKYGSHLSDFEDNLNTGLNIPVIRYAEVLLTYAEAKIELNQIDNSVYEAINKIRERAGMPDVDQSVYNTQAKMRELVRRERRVELAFEGLRWFDIQRWKIAEDKLNGPVYGSRFGTVDQNTGEVTFDDSGRILSEHRTFDAPKNYLWPIPQSEMDANKNLKQNPGY